MGGYLGFLAGMGQAAHERSLLQLQDKHARRNALGELFMKVAEHPGLDPGSAQSFLQLAANTYGTPSEKFDEKKTLAGMGDIASNFSKQQASAKAAFEAKNQAISAELGRRMNAQAAAPMLPTIEPVPITPPPGTDAPSGEGPPSVAPTEMPGALTPTAKPMAAAPPAPVPPPDLGFGMIDPRRAIQTQIANQAQALGLTTTIKNAGEMQKIAMEAEALEKAGYDRQTAVTMALGHQPPGLTVFTGEQGIMNREGKVIKQPEPGVVTVPQGAVATTKEAVRAAAAGAPPSGGAMPGIQVPMLPPPEVRTAIAAWAAKEGKKPDQIAGEEQAKAVAWWKQISDPLGTKLKLSTIDTQAITRAVQQNELDLANDPEVVRTATIRYLQTGQMPAMGMRSQVMRGAILRDAAAVLKEKGISPEQAGVVTEAFKASSKSLADIQKRRAQVETFERTARRNLDNFIGSAQGVIDSGSPIVNRVFRGAAREGLGDPKLAAFDAYRVTAFTEISRVLSGQMGQQLSDASRKEAEQILKGSYTIPQLVAAAKALKTDMTVRTQELDRETQKIQREMGSLLATGPTPITPPPGHDPLGIR